MHLALSKTEITLSIHLTMNTSGENISVEPQLPYAMFYGSIMFLGLPLNVVALWILLRRHNLKSPSVVFMVNLAISDLLLVISLPLRVYFYATGTWPLRDFACISINALFGVNIRSSAIFITFISVDRMLAVVYPLRSRHIRTAYNAGKAAISAWLFVVIISIPKSIALGKHLKDHNESYCFEHPQDQDDHKCMELLVIHIFQLVLILTLLSVNVVSTLLVSWTLHRHVSDLAKVNNKVNVMHLYIMSLIMFMVCFLPGSIGKLIKGTHTYLTCIASANCCLDPILYYFSLDSFWKKKEERNQITVSRPSF